MKTEPIIEEYTREGKTYYLVCLGEGGRALSRQFTERADAEAFIRDWKRAWGIA